MSLAGCAISGDRSATGLTAEAAAIEQIVDPKTLEKPNLTVGYVPVNDCAPFAIAWQKGFFRKYGLNVKLNRTEFATAFIDKKAFDPSDPVRYLNSFEMRANRPKSFFMSS